MKKLSLLLALAIFGFGSATMVNAEEVESSSPDSVIIEGIEAVPSEEELPMEADTDGDGLISEKEAEEYEANLSTDDSSAEAN